MNYWHWIYERVRRQLWWRAVAYGIAGMLTAVLALVAERIFPWEIPFNLTPDAVDSLLNIIASSMLAVTTFSLGRVGTTIDRVEAATSAALTERQEQPYLGANPWFDLSTLPVGATPVHARTIGYIQFIDIQAIAHLCEEAGCEAYLPLNPGTFVFEDTVLAWLHAPDGLASGLMGRVAGHFIIATNRSFDQDPRFGLAVMAEIGSRALSPATNDPGTAIDVIGRLTRLLAHWAEGRADVPVRYPQLHLHPLSDADLFEDAFMLMARDGARLIEVQLRLQKSLTALQRLGGADFQQAAAAQAALALERSLQAMDCETDRQRLQALVAAGD